MPIAAQALLGTELALLLASVVALVSLERERERVRRDRTTTTDRGSRSERSTDLLAGLAGVSGATALVAAVIGATALAEDRLELWEKAVVSSALVLVLVGVAASYLARVRLQAGSLRALSPWLGATMAAAVTVIVAFALVGSAPADRAGDVVFPVYGTSCLSAGCGLKQRAGPGSQYPEVGPRLADGTDVSIECRVVGLPVAGHSSLWWDRIAPGSFVSDAFIDRPKDGRPPYIRLCPGESGG